MENLGINPPAATKGIERLKERSCHGSKLVKNFKSKMKRSDPRGLATIDPDSHAIGSMSISIDPDPWNKNIIHFSAYNRWSLASATRDVPPFSWLSYYSESQLPWVDAYWYWDEYVNQ